MRFYLRYLSVVLVLLLFLAGCSTHQQIPRPPDATLANELLMRSIGLVGTPYVYGGNTPASGFDCSGLIVFVYRDVAGISLPRTVRSLSQLPWPQVPRTALQPGDLVLFAPDGGSGITHAGIYVDENRFVHAPSSGGTVRLDTLLLPYWQSAYRGAKRMPEFNARAMAQPISF